MSKFYEGHGEESPDLDTVLHLDGEPRVAQIPHPKWKFETLTESVERALKEACQRCDYPWTLIPIDLTGYQKRPCTCADKCGWFCAGLPPAPEALNG